MGVPTGASPRISRHRSARDLPTGASPRMRLQEFLS